MTNHLQEKNIVTVYKNVIDLTDNDAPWLAVHGSHRQWRSLIVCLLISPPTVRLDGLPIDLTANSAVWLAVRGSQLPWCSLMGCTLISFHCSHWKLCGLIGCSLMWSTMARPDWLFFDLTAAPMLRPWSVVLWCHLISPLRQWCYRLAIYFYLKTNVRHYWLFICIGWALRSKLEKKRRHVVFIELLKKSVLERVWPTVRTKRWTLPFNTSLIKLT
jgi:hypothetical protein